MRRVSVYSVSRKRVLWSDCGLAETVLERGTGIMFRHRVGKPLAIPFASRGRRRNSIHSFACPVFDAVFLDEGKVVDVRPQIPPHQLLVVPAKACSLVLELPSGQSRKVKIGDKLLLR